MHGKLASTALLGFSAIAAAAPWGNSWSTTVSSSYSTASVASSTHSSVSASGTAIPPINDLDNISAADLAAIEQVAGGTLSNATGGAKPSGNSITSVAFVAFNELFEVAFFTELVYNITNNVHGFDHIPNRDSVLNILKVHLADEELHAINAIKAVQGVANTTIAPCQYTFPVTTFNDSIALASKFTDVVLSTLPDIQTIFAQNNDAGLIRGVGSVIGQEGEQDGFYRELLGKVPAQLPFLTAGARNFAFNAINQNFIVPGSSCPARDTLLAGLNGGEGLKLFDVLNIETSASEFTDETDIEATFSVLTSTQQPAAQSFAVQSTPSNCLTYINQQNVPLQFPVTLELSGKNDGKIEFTAPFPGKTHFLNGLTIAVVTDSCNLTDVDQISEHTVFGPALIEVN
ncbi:hypothetical protein BAUCODRAFT_330006 [Baudoinia panamericana UAMH 10762]|uniref:Late sexual development protein n=1 Tax=Baudoinia panamericana (strain UAMH 10762) TaxID=717646 RepID=M2MJL1_BAUPA|nr:uncharacterized protein BAUCODRAFT_330006 [Baudoinia panamericana UAMH 10762]EMC91483.1 hypothetical protein BAUCODRAFT_330006 [Baudoinia panamericana UAMH 10762]